MKKHRVIFTLAVCILSAAILLTGCNGKKEGSASKSSETKLTGTYLLDATALGMPLQVYLFIKDDNTFQWTNQKEKGDDKGHGTIGQNENTYLLLCSDSTTEAPKTATFTVVKGNLHFSTRVPYGTSGFSPNTEDESNIIYPQAKKLAFEAYIAEYVGVSGDYSYTLSLSYGAQYTVTSVGKTETYSETGIFDIKDKNLTLTPTQGAAISGIIDENSGIALTSAKLEKTGKKSEIKLSKAITADYAGVYTAEGEIQLTLDKLGGYTYQAKGYSEEGAFTVDNDAAVFTAKNGDKRNGTVATYIAKASFPKTAAGKVAEFTAYESVINGDFTATEEVKEGEETPAGKYEASLKLGLDGAYSFNIIKDGKQSYSESGTFSTSVSAVGPSLDLTSKNRDNSSGVIAKNGELNLRILIDSEMNEAGFKFTKRK